MEDRNDIVIDPEFAALLVPLTAQEEALLAESLKREGCKEPLTVWKGHGVLLDGHARLRIARANGIPFAVAEVELPDREAARRWVWQRQAGRRNLRPVAAAYTRGLLYRSLKKRPGARTDLSSGPKGRRWASSDVATLFGVDESTVRRDGRFARDLDLVARELGEEFKHKVLTGEARLSRWDIARLLEMDRSEKERYVARLKEEKACRRAARRKPAASSTPLAAVAEAGLATRPAGPVTGVGVLPDENPWSSSMPPAAASPASTDGQPPAASSARTGQDAGYDREAPVIDHRRDEPTDAPASRDEPAPVEEQVDEAIVDQLSELFHRANHSTRLEFLGQPLVRTALRRLAATPALSA